MTRSDAALRLVSYKIASPETDFFGLAWPPALGGIGAIELVPKPAFVYRTKKFSRFGNLSPNRCQRHTENFAELDGRYCTHSVTVGVMPVVGVLCKHRLAFYYTPCGDKARALIPYRPIDGLHTRQSRD